MSVRFDSSTDTLRRALSGFGNIGTTGFTACWFVRVRADRNTFSCPFAIDNGTAYILIETEDDGLNMYLMGSTGTILLGATTIDTWYFQALTYDNASFADAYQAEATATGALPAAVNLVTNNFTPNQYFVSGSHFGGEWLDGNVCGLRIWRNRLTPAELEAERRQIAPVRTADLYAFYPLLDSTTRLSDLSGNGNALTNLSGTPSPSTEANPPVPWRFSNTLRYFYKSGENYGDTIDDTIVASDTAAGTVVLSGIVADIIASSDTVGSTISSVLAINDTSVSVDSIIDAVSSRFLTLRWTREPPTLVGIPEPSGPPVFSDQTLTLRWTREPLPPADEPEDSSVSAAAVAQLWVRS